MGPCEDPSIHRQNQAKGTSAHKAQRARRPRSRTCLLKGCGQVFRPDHPLARYCSEHCRSEAAKWREWKARHKYRKTARGKQVRRAQSRRYRIRQKEGKKQRIDTVSGARVITRKFFFVLLRSPRVIRGIPSQPAVAAAALLLPCMSPGSRTSSGAGEALVGAPSQPTMNSH